MNQYDARTVTWSLRPGDVAAMIGVSSETVRRWADTGALPCWRSPNGYRRFRPQDVESLIRAGREPVRA